MEVVPNGIGDVFPLVGVLGAGTAEDASRDAALHAFQPLLVLRADALGRVIDVEDFGWAADPELAARLADDLAARLAGRETCCREVSTAAGTRLAFAVRLPDGNGREILACLVSPSDQLSPCREDTRAALVLCAAMAAAARHQRDERTLQRARIDQLVAQHDALRTSHAEALAAAIEEREERLREQQEHTSQLQAVMMMAADGIVTLDQHGTIES